jgi:hypothetical protein
MSVFSSDGTENQMRWDRTSDTFMEVWYSTLTHEPSGCGVWVRYTITAPSKGDPYCEVWGFVFDPNLRKSFAGKQRYGIDALGAFGRDDGALVRIADSWVSENHLEGSVTHAGRLMTWSLGFEPQPRCFQHLPQPIRRRAERTVSTVCSPNLMTPFTGVVKVDDDEYEFSGSSGMQSHRWGRKHASTWAWGHCSHFDGGADATFEALAAKASLGFLPGPTLTFAFLHLEGEDIAFNELRWVRRARSSYTMPTWAFSAHTDTYKVVGASRAHPDRLIQLDYQDPDGSHRYCANSEIADLALEVYGKTGAGWRHHRSLTATGTSHLEFGRKEPFEELAIAF